MTESIPGTETGPYSGGDGGPTTGPGGGSYPASGTGRAGTPDAGAEGSTELEGAITLEVTAGAAAETVPGPGHVDRPLALSAGLSVLFGVLAILLVANSAGQVVALGIGLGGALGLGLGIEVRHRGHRLAGIVLCVLGLLGIGAGVAWAVIGTASVDLRIEVLPGIFGLALLVAGVMAAKRGYERFLISAGTGGILLTVFVAGMVNDAAVAAMLGAMASTVAAWDCGEQAVNLGQQIGRQAKTWRAELVHGGAGLLVGGVGVAVGIGFVTAGVSGLPLMGLITLLAAAVVLGAGLYL